MIVKAGQVISESVPAPNSDDEDDDSVSSIRAHIKCGGCNQFWKLPMAAENVPLFPERQRRHVDSAISHQTVHEAKAVSGETVDANSGLNYLEMQAGIDVSLQHNEASGDSELHRALLQLKSSAEMLYSAEDLKIQTLNEVANQKEQARLEKAVAEKNSAIKDYTDTSQNHPEANRAERQNTREGEVEAIEKEDSTELFQSLPDSNKSTEHKSCTTNQDEVEATKKKHTFDSEDLVLAEQEIEKLQIELRPFAQEMMDNFNTIQKAKDTAYEALEKALDLLRDTLEEKLVAANVASTSSEEAQSESGQDSEQKTTDSIASTVKEDMEGLIVELATLRYSVSQRKQTTSKQDRWRETLRGPSEAKESLSVSSRMTDLNSREVFADLQKARIAEVLAAEKARSKVDELEEVKIGLKKAANENSTLSSTTDSLRIRWNITKTELQSLLDRHKTALAVVSATKDQIKKIKADTASALSAEVTSKEVISALAIGFQDMSVEADKAKVLHKEAIQDARNAKIAARQANTAIITRKSNLQASYREAEAAKVSEAIALKEIKYLSQPRRLHVVQNEPNAQTVDKEQYDSLHKKLEEAEKQATEKVAEAMKLLKAEKAAQQELLNQLEAAMADMEAIKLKKQQALLQAEEAEASKVAVEGELRKWRAENGGRRRAVDSIAVATPSPRYNGRLVFPETPEKVTSKTDHFAEVFQLSMPPPSEKVYPVNNKQVALKKMRLFARITSFFSKKKSQIKAELLS